MKQFFVLALLTCVSVFSVQAQRKDSPVVAGNPEARSLTDQAFVEIIHYDGFLPQTPVIYGGQIPVWGTDAKDVNKESMLSLINKQDVLRRLLPDFTLDYYIRKISKDGKVLYGMTGVTGEPGNYEITFDITKSTTIPVGANGENSGLTPNSFVRVGVGIRIKASVTTSKPSIDVSNLDHLAMAAMREELHGGLSFQLFGIDGESVVLMAPNSNAKIEASSIDTFMQSVATLKSRMNDKSITLVPPCVCCPAQSNRYPFHHCRITLTSTDHETNHRCPFFYLADGRHAYCLIGFLYLSV